MQKHCENLPKDWSGIHSNMHSHYSLLSPYIIVYQYFGLQTKTHKIPKNLKMNFNGQPNMFFGKIISYTCDFHLKLNILNPLNIMFMPNV
jgi:hypothetical protein